jgi:aminoglycoside 6'-N-acetyltransferase
MTRSDLAPLLDILSGPGVAEWWGAYDTDRIRAEFLDDPEAHGFIVEVDGQPAGLIDFYEELEPDYHSASLDIAIADGFRRRGYGGEAMRALMDFLIGCRGHHRMTVDPAAANAQAISFYEGLGFRHVGVMQCYERGADGVWHDNLLMEHVTCHTDRLKQAPSDSD